MKTLQQQNLPKPHTNGNPHALQQRVARWARVSSIVVLVIISTVQVYSQTQIPRSVMGYGGNAIGNQQYRINGTVSQATIGRTSTSAYNHNIGYWYTVQQLFAGNRYAAVVVVPNTHATPGEVFKMPVVLQQSKNLSISSAKSFTAMLRFNATLLEPTNKSNYTRTGDTGWVRIGGSLPDSIGILTEVEFTAKLGNNETTQVVIENFAINETPLVRIITKDGTFALDGVCREGGEVRLTKNGKATALQMFPNPVVHTATLQATLTERGQTEVYLVDVRGVTITTFYKSDAVPGSLQLTIDASDIPSGSYFVMMRTPNELFSQKVIVEK